MKFPFKNIPFSKPWPRSDCFNTPFFGGCVKALLMEEKEDELTRMKYRIG